MWLQVVTRQPDISFSAHYILLSIAPVGAHLTLPKIMSNETKQREREPGLLVLFAVSYAIFIAAFVVDQTFRWSNHLDGLKSGLLQGAIFGVAWCVIYVLPWSLIMIWLHRWRKWTRSRSGYILAPSYFIFVLFVAGLLFSPPTARRRFSDHAKMDLPGDVADLRYKLSGGGVADTIDSYYFRTSPEQVEQLIKGMNLSAERSHLDSGYSPISKLPDAPDPKAWVAASLYSRNEGIWWYYLLANSSKTEVYILMMHI